MEDVSARVLEDAFQRVRESLTSAAASDGVERLAGLESLKYHLQAQRNFPNRSLTCDGRVNKIYVELLELLLNELDSKWRRGLTLTQEKELFDAFFLLDLFLEDSFLFLVKILDECSFSHKFDKALYLVECLLMSPCTLGQMFLHQCTSLENAIQRECRSDLWKELVTCLVSLPDRIANKYQHKPAPNIFKADVYFQWVLQALIWALQGLYHKLTSEMDCSTQFLSIVLGRSCLAGNAENVVPALTQYLSGVTINDFVWRRISQKLFSGLPDNCVEAVLTCLFRRCTWYKDISRLLGTSLSDNKKVQFLVTNKLLLVRTFDEDQVLHNIIGYLADVESLRKIYIDVLLHLLDVWGNKSSLKHRPFSQHRYMTKALLICVAHLSDEIKTHYKQDILRLIMHGVESHLSNPALDFRRLGLFTAESIVKTVDPEGPQINFQYEKDEEIAELKKLLTLPTDPGIHDLSTDLTSLEIKGQELNSEEIDAFIPTTNEDLDSDDDLEPYDMSNDTAFRISSAPRYLRDCMAGLIENNDPERTQTCLETAESLVRADSVGLSEVAVEMTNILLHLDNNSATQDFMRLRHGALTALTVYSPLKVSEYLCEQFYDRNYNLRQRMDILEVLVAASQELSQAKTPSKKLTETSASNFKKVGPQIGRFESPLPTTEDWRQIIQKRIDAKTRRFVKGRSRPEPVQVASRFSAVAGYFFYPLVKHYDCKENTFDLLGSDFYVLGRLIYSLGMILHAAVNAPIAIHIGQAFLEFVWVMRYHVEPYVRQAIIFGICMTVVTVPSHALVSDLQAGLLDWQKWLNDVVTNDSDAECQKLALKALMMIESAIKEELTRQTAERI